MAHPFRPRGLVSVLAAVVVPAPAYAQPSVTAVAIDGACAGTGAYCGNRWSTMPGAPGNWQMFLSTDACATYKTNPLAAIPLALGVNTFRFASDPAAATSLALNVFLDGATANPTISGYASQSAIGTLASNAGQSTYNPYAASTPGGIAAGLSFVSGPHTVTLTRLEYGLDLDRVGADAPRPNGSRVDYLGVFDLTVRPSSAVPEPATSALVGGGSLGLGLFARRRRGG